MSNSADKSASDLPKVFMALPPEVKPFTSQDTTCGVLVMPRMEEVSTGYRRDLTLGRSHVTTRARRNRRPRGGRHRCGGGRARRTRRRFVESRTAPDAAELDGGRQDRFRYRGIAPAHPAV